MDWSAGMDWTPSVAEAVEAGARGECAHGHPEAKAVEAEAEVKLCLCKVALKNVGNDSYR
jgi:hypothetical protein